MEKIMVTNWLFKTQTINSEYGELPAEMWLAKEMMRLAGRSKRRYLIDTNYVGKIALFRLE